MKILMASSEALPFAASGGLADVVGSLPAALRKRIVGCRVVMPLYDDIAPELRAQMQFIGSLTVPVSWRQQYCGVFEARANGVIYYLLDNQYYFKREGLYGFYDDGERFAFFARAVLEILPMIGYQPDIIQAHDWQAALIPIYYNLFYGQNEWYQSIKTLFTIHNIQYQGKYGLEVLEDVFGIPMRRAGLVEYDGCVNLMKGAIEAADAVNTVSPTYAQELQDAWYAYGLHEIIRARSWKICGILNGIDVDNYNPETDSKLYVNYTAETVTAGKAENKRRLQEEMGLAQRADVPLIGMVTRLTEQKGLDLLRYIADRLMSEHDVQFVLLGTGDAEYESFFREMQQRYPGRFCAYIGFVPALSRKIYGGADLFLMPSKSEPCGLAQMIALRYGTVPVVRATGGLKDSVFDADGENGNGYRFDTYNADDLYGSLCRALACYGDRPRWDALVQRAMASDNSWNNSAGAYMRLYRKMLSDG